MTETSEREMVRKNEEAAAAKEKFSSLQPTYEDSVLPEEDDWEYDD